MRSLAIIPARGGSKRVPGKNLAWVGAQTMLMRAIDAGSVCTRVVVSTDAEEVRHACVLAVRNGVCALHHRKPEHATDEAQLEPVIDDVLAEHPGYDAVVLLQPTSPLRTAAHVAGALKLLEESRCDAVVSVTRLHSLHPCFNGNTGPAWEGGDTRPSDRYQPRELGGRPSSQSLSHLCYENGAIYAFTLKHWERRRNRGAAHRDDRVLVYTMHWSEAVEVDTMEDLEAARRLCR